VADETDAVLLEAVRTHRTRLRGAFLLGDLAERREVNDNVRRLIGSLVLAAVACAGTVGTAFVIHAIEQQTATSTVSVPSATSAAP
jgi:hypothetical protein